MKTKLLTLGLLGLLFLGCQKEDLTTNSTVLTPSSSTNVSSNTVVSSTCEQEFELLAGQYINVGNIIVSNDDDFIYVTFNTENGWVLNETHVYVGDPNGIPTNGAGNPQIGLFPYRDAHNGATSFTVTVPIDSNLECYAVAAHASVSLIDNGTVIQSETAWSNGNPINNGGSWATYSEYCLTDCCEYETVSYDYFAGQTIPVGSLNVTNDDQNLYVTFDFSGGDWYTQQTHLYVGPASDIPKNGANIPIPGQFPYVVTHNPAVQTYTYTIPLGDLDPCYVIAAHSEMIQVDGDGNIVSEETGWSFGTEFPDTPRWGWYSEYCTQICN
ncbi:MAG: hypothetical protein HRT58_08605 [Crocinitomicaceae bacterium]|nr:hypothetical protein [Flavobacteriales bacterium]NQZ35711.1 hypothetical protein [Crocinitomicaceae bacterium]